MNQDLSCRVRLVVDPTFGERLAALPESEAVWVVQSPANTPVAQRLWAERPRRGQQNGITTFRPGQPDLPEEHLLSILNEVDLHHGPLAARPPYSVLEVIGCRPTTEVVEALGALGLVVVETRADGFTATRRGPGEMESDAE